MNLKFYFGRSKVVAVLVLVSFLLNQIIPYPFISNAYAAEAIPGSEEGASTVDVNEAPAPLDPTIESASETSIDFLAAAATEGLSPATHNSVSDSDEGSAETAESISTEVEIPEHIQGAGEALREFVGDQFTSFTDELLSLRGRLADVDDDHDVDAHDQALLRDLPVAELTSAQFIDMKSNLISAAYLDRNALANETITSSRFDFLATDGSLGSDGKISDEEIAAMQSWLEYQKPKAFSDDTNETHTINASLWDELPKPDLPPDPTNPDTYDVADDGTLWYGLGDTTSPNTQAIPSGESGIITKLLVDIDHDDVPDVEIYLGGNGPQVWNWERDSDLYASDTDGDGAPDFDSLMSFDLETPIPEEETDPDDTGEAPDINIEENLFQMKEFWEEFSKLANAFGETYAELAHAGPRQLELSNGETIDSDIVKLPDGSIQATVGEQTQTVFSGQAYIRLPGNKIGVVEGVIIDAETGVETPFTIFDRFETSGNIMIKTTRGNVLLEPDPDDEFKYTVISSGDDRYSANFTYTITKHGSALLEGDGTRVHVEVASGAPGDDALEVKTNQGTVTLEPVSGSDNLYTVVTSEDDRFAEGSQQE